MNYIAKEDIKNLNFPQEDVIPCTTERVKRFVTALKARSLGNIEKTKVSIHFKGNDNNYVVDTTVWDVDNDFIVLKCSTALPLRSIYSINLS
jgi:hypothetical protein